MALADAEIVLEGYVNPRDRRFETKESEDSGIAGPPPLPSGMGRLYGQRPAKAPRFHVTAVTMRKPASKPIVFALSASKVLDAPFLTSTRP